MDVSRSARKSLPRGLRFDVFKRDSFKCQYCGAVAPDVLLQIDHINPVSKGGSDDITNLTTSCQACNSGKSNKTLDENAAVAKSRAQLEQLQERREQLEMMMAWREGLRDLKDEAVDRVAEYWHELAPGFTVRQHHRNSLQKWLRAFSIEEVCDAMDVAAEQYLKFGNDETVTRESWIRAFGKISGVCSVERASGDEPDLKGLLYIRGIIRNRLVGYYDNAQALELLRSARKCDVPLDELSAIAKCVSSWTQFQDHVYTAIDEYKQA